MTYKFKVGDKVFANDLTGGSGKELDWAAIYTISRNKADNMVELFGLKGGFYQDRFELITTGNKLNSRPTEKPKALQTQVGGTHYSDMAIQPAAYNLANNMGWAEGDAISYISRWRKKGGLQDLRKARQTLLLLIEHEEGLGTE